MPEPVLLNFFERTINIAAIKEIGPLRRAAGHPLQHRVHFADGEYLDIDQTRLDRLLQRPIQLIPPEPGTLLLYLAADGEETPWISRTPLIAWALCVDGSVRPVTPIGVEDGTDEPFFGWFVRMPDGSVHAVNGVGDQGFFKGEEELLAYGRRWKEQRAAERAIEETCNG